MDLCMELSVPAHPRYYEVHQYNFTNYKSTVEAVMLKVRRFSAFFFLLITSVTFWNTSNFSNKKDPICKESDDSCPRRQVLNPSECEVVTAF